MASQAALRITQTLGSVLNTPVESFPGADLFGYAASARTFARVLDLLKDTVGEDAISAAAAYGMLLSIHTHAGGPHREDALDALDRLCLAKLLLDRVVSHSRPVIDVTAGILAAAQVFADETTIPCTEWPSVAEIAAAALDAARRYARTGDWTLCRYDERGAVIGVRVVTL